MNEENFIGALRKLGGVADRKAARLFTSLYESEKQANLLEYELSDSHIREIENEIEQMKDCIRDTAKNNEDHQRRIISIAHIMGSIIVKPEFENHFKMKRQIERHKRMYEAINRKVEENRLLLKQSPQKPRNIAMNTKIYQEIVDNYLKAERDLFYANQEYENYEVDTESLAFSLADEVNEYQNSSKKLDIDVDDFDPTSAIGGIFGAADLSDYDYDEP